jgi:uroporphyrinogen decarboxylase
MTSRERVKAIIAGRAADRCGFWLGNPHPESWPGLNQYFHTSEEEELRRLLQDDFRWIEPSSAYRHPAEKPIFDVQRKGKELSIGGYFSDCEDPRRVEEFDWPDPDYLDFSEILNRLRNSGDIYRASGFWCPFFHDVADFLGMDNYFLKMYTHPEVVHAITGRILAFYLDANRRLFDQAGDLIDGFFFGNDFGTQLDLLISPEMLEEFIFPYFKQLIDLAKSYHKQVLLHSCGSIFKIIPRLIELGVDGLHPLQARAANMQARNLAAQFHGKIAFIGGVDTQELLIHSTPAEIKKEVKRLMEILGPRLIVSPSHEAILPDIPPANIEAMAQAVITE